jgi:hypothetical protein
VPVVDVQQTDVQDSQGNFVPRLQVVFTVANHEGTFTVSFIPGSDPVTQASDLIAAYTQSIEGIYSL